MKSVFLSVALIAAMPGLEACLGGGAPTPAPVLAPPSPPVVVAAPAPGPEAPAPPFDPMPVPSGPASVDDDALARAVIEEINAIRTDPGAYVVVLQAYREQFRGAIVHRPGRIDIATGEGVSAVDEAIRFLRRQPAISALAPDTVLRLSAGDHVADQGPTGRLGHQGSDGLDFAARIARRGGDPYGGEAIAYGYDTAREVVIQLLVDDNVPGRGHRTNLFNPAYVRAGAACGPHRAFNHMCVIDLGYAPRPR